MRLFITKSLEVLSYLAMLLIVLGAAGAGYNQGGFFGLLAGLIVGVIIAVVAFGAVFLLMDTADNTRRMVQLMEQRRQ